MGSTLRAIIQGAVIFTIVLSTPLLRAQHVVAFGDSMSFAEAINDSNQVVGGATFMGDQHAFLYSDGIMSDLGTLGGANSWSRAVDINNTGVIVGFSQETDNDSTDFSFRTIAFIYSGGTMNDLGSSTGKVQTAATSINQTGQIAGSYCSDTHTYQYRACVYSSGGASDVGSLAAYFSRVYINNSGLTVGTYTHAVSYSGGTENDLGTLGGTSSRASGVNSAGHIIGSSSLAGSYYSHAFLYDGTMRDLGVLGDGNSSDASDINDSDMIVGWSNFSSTSIGMHAFLYTPEKGLQDLNVLYDFLLVSGTDAETGFISFDQATAINNSGNIVGQGTYWDGTTAKTKIFLLTVVPEPSTWVLLNVGLVLLALSQHRRKQTTSR